MSTLVGLEIKNFRNIKFARIDKTGSVLTIGGGNEQGKTNLQHAIRALYGGAKSTPANALLRGAKNGYIKGIEEDGTETRLSLKQPGNHRGSMTIEANGEPVLGTPSDVNGPKAKYITLDPSEFCHKGGDEIETIICRISGLAMDEYRQMRKHWYDRRRDINREVKRLEAETDGKTIAEVDDTKSMQDVLTEKAEITRVNRTIQDASGLFEDLRLILNDLGVEFSGLEATKKLLPTIKDLRTCDEEIMRISSIEAILRENKVLAANLQSLEDAQKESETCTEKIESLDAGLAKEIKTAKLPIKSLSIKADGVFYKDLPIEDASDGAKTLLGVALIMAALEKSQESLRVILLKNAAWLDRKNRAKIAAMAERHDWWVWMELVDEAADVVVEDGEIK